MDKKVRNIHPQWLKGSCPAHGDELCFGKLAVSPPVRGCAGAWYATTKN